MEQFLLDFLRQFPIAAPILFIVIRSTALVVPPIPGLMIDSVGIVLFSWKLGFLYSWGGLVLGAMISFWIARYFKVALIKRFPSLKKFESIEHSLNTRQEILTLIAMRVFSNPLLDYLNYAIGFTRVSAFRFFITAVVGYFPYSFTLYFFGDKIIRHTSVQVVGVIGSLLVLVLVYRNYRLKNLKRG
jgi:uncharacterized membrane protein YdjX (TVP38/TMEM64 family)